MCVKLPSDEADMLEVSGVAAAKYEKYGERFLEAIRSFVQEHPGQVISSYQKDEQQEKGDEEESQDVGSRRKKAPKEKKLPFSLSGEEAASVHFGGLCPAVELRDRLKEVSTADNMKAVTGADITRYLQEEGFLEERKDDRGFMRIRPSKKGEEHGIQEEERISKAGNSYYIPIFPERIQKLVAEHYIRTGEEEA